MAQIAMEVFRGNAKHPDKVKLDTFLFTKKLKKPKVKTSPEKSKKHWLTFLGLKDAKQ